MNCRTEEPPICADELDRIEGLKYKTAHLRKLLDTPARKPDSAFWRYLVRQAFESAIPFDSIMKTHDGYPVGVEYRHGEREAWAVIHPDTNSDASWRLTRFASCGFTGHDTHTTLANAVQQMVVDGYRRRDDGALDRLSGTHEWEKGVQLAVLIQQLNSRALSPEQFERARGELLMESAGKQ